MSENLQADLTVTAEIKLYYDLYVPRENHPVGETPTPRSSRKEGSQARPLLIAVHGYGAHKRYMMREAKLVANDKFLIASLEAPHPHYRPTKDGGYAIGYGWLSSERAEENIRLHHKFVLDVIDKLDGDGLIDRKQVFMYGFSQACALNFRFAFTYPEVLRGIVGVGGGIPGDLDTNTIYKPSAAETFYLYGDDDEFYTQQQFAEFNKKLAATLANYTSKHYAAKHEITDEMRRDIKRFLAKAL